MVLNAFERAEDRLLSEDARSPQPRADADVDAVGNRSMGAGSENPPRAGSTAMSDDKRRLYGTICMWAGIIGGLQAVVLVAVPAKVDEARFSYPFDVAGHAAAQTSFFAQHLGLLVGLVALGRLAAARERRSSRLGLRAGILGMALLALMELIAIVPADDVTSSDTAELVSGLYSVPVLLLGVGLLVGGVGLARRTGRTDPAWFRWIPAALGAWVFVPLTPALMGSFEAGRAAIGSWMLLFAGLGWGLSRGTFETATAILDRAAQGTLR